MLPPAPRNDPAHPPRVSVYIIAFNEAEKIRDAVSSVLWADEIIVADSHSTDGTPQIAEGSARASCRSPFNGFGDLRNRAIEACRGDWIFSLDSDERCTPEVRDEILAHRRGQPMRSTSTACRAATTSWAAGSATRAGIRTIASRSCSGKRRDGATRSSRCTRATGC